MSPIFCGVLLFLLCYMPSCDCLGYYWRWWRDEERAGWLLELAEDVMKSSDNILDGMENLRQDNMKNAPFEIGYSLFHIQEKYRKMVDKYNTTYNLLRDLYSMEIMLYMTEVEALYYELEHVVSVNGIIEIAPKSRRQLILNDLSWAVKAKILKNPVSTTTETSRRVGMEAFVLGRRQAETEPSDASPPEPPHTSPHFTPNTTAPSSSADDGNMRNKLFRLMYETVRDSDLKVKRAELIKAHYSNSSIFEIGYLMGDVTDKFNIMTDIAMTLKRLYNDWKPIEHINAYEQIANQAIEISHLVDMVKTVGKKVPPAPPPHHELRMRRE